MLHLNRVASSITFARSLAISCAVAWCLLSLECSHAQQPSDQSIEQLIKQLHQPLRSGRAHAATRLARYGERASQATDHLIECLSDTDTDLRLAAAYALGCVQQDSLRVLSSLVPVLDDADEHVRYSAQWSIARIAKGLSNELDSNRRRSLISTLKTAIDHLDAHEHQARHRIAVELALAQLRQDSPDAPSPAPPIQTAQQPDAPVPTATSGDGMELARRIYAANDMLSRLHFIELLRDLENYPDDLRRAVIGFECEQDMPVLSYAIARWSAHGQKLLNEEFDKLSRSEPLEPTASEIVALLKPVSEQQIERLLELVHDRTQPFGVRDAALTALSAAEDFGPRCTNGIVGVLADVRLEHELRLSAANVLAEQGPAAVGVEARLITLLQSEREPWLRCAIAHALARTCAASPEAARAMCKALRETSADSDSYYDMLECCGQFGHLAGECSPELVAALNHKDEGVRIGSANALQQLGPAASAASDALVARILQPDETTRVKVSAAKALRAISPEQGKQLVPGLMDRNSVTCEHSLRALAIIGPTAAPFASRECVAILNDPAATTAVRSAAATALGAMGDASAVPKLLELTASEHPGALRAASLLAAAQIDPGKARPHVERCRHEESRLLRASAACGLRLVGQAKAGFDMLVGMLDGSDTDAVIELALAEFGPEGEPWLLAVASDAEASTDMRLGCVRIMSQLPSPSWQELLPLLGDDEVGDEIAMAIDWRVHEEPDTIAFLLAQMRDHDLKPATHARLVRLFHLDGLGAAGDEESAEQWQGALALQQPAAVETLAAAEFQDAPMAEAAAPSSSAPALPSVVTVPAVPSLPTDAMQPPAASWPSSEPMGGSGSGDARSSRARPIKPSDAARATGAQPRVPATPAVPQIVEVFYGTNRARIVTEASPHELATSLLATAGGGLLAMLICLLGFLRSGHRPFAIVALIAIGAVAPFGFQAARNYSRSASQPMVAYSGDYRPEIELGVCEVSIPPGHKPGELESPQLLKLEVKQDVAKHVVVTSVEQLSKERFFNQLHARMEADGKNILVFIHGYNVSFEDAARRTAQMAEDLKFPGAPVFYSWPSQANWYGYKTDKENIELSVTQIKSFLLDLAAQSGATTINLVAHSMGNVGLTQALKEMEGLSPQPLFNQVVLAAPDIDADIFKHRVAPHIVTKAQHITLYTSQTDLALIASRYFNSGARVGDSGPGVLLFPGIDTIDATSVDSSLLGHSYYGSNVSVLTDLGHVLQNQPVTNRQYLRTIIDAAQPYWAFDPLRMSQLPSGEPQR